MFVTETEGSTWETRVRPSIQSRTCDDVITGEDDGGSGGGSEWMVDEPIWMQFKSKLKMNGGSEGQTDRVCLIIFGVGLS